MSFTDNRQKWIQQGFELGEMIGDAPLRIELIDYAVSIPHPHNPMLRNHVILSYSRAKDSLGVEQCTSVLTLSEDVAEHRDDYGTARIEWEKPFFLSLSAWLVSDDFAELHVKISAIESSASKRRRGKKVTVGFSVFLSQDALSSELPLKEESLPYMSPDDFRRVWPSLLAHASIHGFRDSPWVAADCKGPDHWP